MGLSAYGDGYGYGCAYGYGGDGYGDGGSGGGYGGGSGYGLGYGDGGYSGSGGYGGSVGSGYGCGDYGYGYGVCGGYGYCGDGYGNGDGSGYGSGYRPEEYWAAVAQSLDTRKEPSGRTAFWRTKRCGGSVYGADLPGVVEGAIHEEEGPLELCSAGTLHATLNPEKWHGERTWLVALHGEVIEGKHKLGCLKREIVREVNIGVSEKLEAGPWWV